MSDRVVFSVLIIFLSILLIITVFNKQIKEGFNFDPKFGRPPGKISCCGNIDWYLGDEYQKYCPGVRPNAFVNTELVEGFEVKSEIFAPDALVGQKDFDEEYEDCKKMNKEWKPAYNPMICTEGGRIISEANCKCMDSKNNCVKCFPKVDLSKYSGELGE